MASTNTVSDSIKLLKIKQLNLRKAFENYQFHWREIDDLITTIQKSIQSHQPQFQSKSNSNPPKTPIQSNPLTIRPELKSFCEKKNGRGLVHYMIRNQRDNDSLRMELVAAFRAAVAEDSVELVLNAMREFYPKKGKRSGKTSYLSAIRKFCIVLLEILAAAQPQIRAEATAEARELAVEWKGKMSSPGVDKLESYGFLQLLITFDLVSDFDLNEITDHFAHAVVFKKGAKLCAELGLIEKGTDVVQKLISNGNEIFAIRMIIQLGVSDKYPPIPLLKEYVNESVKFGEKICKDGNNSMESKLKAGSKELSALRQVIKVVQEFNFESEYSAEALAERIEELSDERENLRRVLKPKKRKRRKKTPELSQTNCGSSSSGSEPDGLDT